MPALGRCPAGATTAAYPAGGYSANGLTGNIGATGITWPAANVPVARLATLAGDSINVGTDGSVAASLGIIAATFPLLTRITGPEVARNE